MPGDENVTDNVTIANKEEKTMEIYTIRDIARKAGVSVTTVSRVLNGKPDVSRATQERVRRVMAECHFVGNANARGLKQMSSEMAAIIVRGRQNPFLSGLAEEILLSARETGAAFMTEYIDEQADEFFHALQLTHSRRISGLIFLGSRIDERCRVLDGVNMPMVFATVSAAGTPMERASSVAMNEREMARQAGRALLKAGKRLAVFGADRKGKDNLALRFLGIEDALREKGMAFEEARYVETRFTLSDAHAAAIAHFRRFPDTDAVFCMSDTVALGVIRALEDLGRRVPGEVSVMGVDGIEMGEFAVPRLSTIAQPRDEIARKSVEVLLDMMQNAAQARHVTVPGTLKMRESVKQ